MKAIIETLESYLKQVINNKDIDPKRKYILISALSDALQELGYANKLCIENNIKLGD